MRTTIQLLALVGLAVLAVSCAKETKPAHRKAVGPRPAGQQQPAPPQTARLAIVSLPGTPPEVAELLSTHLSTHQDLELYERDQLSAALQEQALDLAQERGALKLGEIVGADGLILLRGEALTNKHRLGVRLLATRPGVVLGHENVLLAPKDFSPWARLAAQRFASLAGKLTVSKDAAVPVSVVSITSPLTSDPAYRLESRLTRMLTERLFGVPEIFVLERQNLGAAKLEKEFQGEQHKAFWNGAYLVSGQLNPDGSPLDRLSVELHLSPSEGGAARVISESGSPRNLRDLVDRLGRRIATEVGRPAEARRWNPAAEANRYLGEAEWYLRWQLHTEARQAAATAAALGSRHPRLKTVELLCLSGLLPFDPQALTPSTEGFRSFNAAQPAPAAQLEFAREALLEAQAGLSDSTIANLPGYYEAAFHTLGNVSLMLRHFSYDPAGRKKHAEPLGEIRRRCREVSAALKKRRTPRGLRPFLIPTTKNYQAKRFRNLHELEHAFGRFWQHDLQAGADWLVAFTSQPEFDLRELATVSTEVPALVCWSQADEARHASVWKQVLDRWSQSKHPAHQIESINRPMRTMRWPRDPELAELQSRLRSVATKFRTQIHGGVVPAEYWKSVTNSLMLTYGAAFASSGWEQFLMDFNRSSRAPKPSATDPNEDPRITFLKTADRYHRSDFSRRLRVHTLDARTATALAPHLKAFGERLSWPQGTVWAYREMLKKIDPTNAPAELRITNIFSDRVQIVSVRDDRRMRQERRFEGKLTPARLTELTRIMDRGLGPKLKHGQTPPPPRATAAIPGLTRSHRYQEQAGAKINVDQFWSLNLDQFPTNHGRALTWRHQRTLYTGGSIWLLGIATLDSRRSPTFSVNHSFPFAVEVSPSTLATRFYPLPEDLTDSNFWSDDWKLQLAAAPESLVLYHDGMLYSRRREGTHQWRKHEGESHGYTHLWGVGAKILLTDDRTIRVLDDNQWRVLASTRRRPPLNVVDRRPRLSIGSAQVTPDGGFVFIDWAHAIYRLNAGMDHWAITEEWTGTQTRTAGDSSFLSESGWTKVWDPRTQKLRTLYDDSLRRPRSLGRLDVFAVPINADRLVRLRVNLSVTRTRDNTRVTDKETGGSHLRLIDTKARTISISPLSFALSADPEKLSGFHSGGMPRLFWTKAGLILAMENIAGFWIINPSDLGLDPVSRPAEFIRNLQPHRAFSTMEPDTIGNARILDHDEIEQRWTGKDIQELRDAASTDPAAAFLLGHRLTSERHGAHYDPRGAIPILTYAATNGVVNAMLLLGRAYEEVADQQLVGVRDEYRSAEKWYRLADKHGLTEGLTAVGEMIYFHDLPGDRKEAYELWQQAAKKGESRAALKLAERDLNNVRSRDIPSASRHLRTAMMGDPRATTQFLDLFFGGGRWHDPDYQGARPLLQLGAEAGSSQCQLQLGILHLEGKDGPVDLERADHWLRRAHQARHFRAARFLGRLHESRNPEKARSWYQIGLKSNDARCAFRLSLLDLAANQRTEAESLLLHAAKLGYRPALDRLAQLNPQAAADFRKQRPMPLVNFDQFHGTWRGKMPQLGKITLHIGATPRGRWRTVLQYQDPESGSEITEARTAHPILPGLEARDIRIMRLEDGSGFAASLRHQLQSLLQPVHGANKPAPSSLIGEWTGKWNNKYPFRLKITEPRRNSFQLDYLYTNTENGVPDQPEKFSSSRQQTGLTAMAGPADGGIGYTINNVPDNPDQLRISTRISVMNPKHQIKTTMLVESLIDRIAVK